MRFLSLFTLLLSLFFTAAPARAVNYPAATTIPQKTDDQWDLLWRLLTGFNSGAFSAQLTNATVVVDQSSISNLLVVSSNLLYQLRVNSTNGTTALSRDRITYSQAWVLTNASVQDYIYMRGTNGFFAKPGGSGMIQSISISGATNHTGAIHLFGYPPLETTNGAIWNNDLFGQGATNRMGSARSLVYLSKAGTNYVVGCDANIPVQNRDGTTNLYWIVTGAATSVTNYPGQYGTNYGVTFSGVSDDPIQ